MQEIVIGMIMPAHAMPPYLYSLQKVCYELIYIQYTPDFMPLVLRRFTLKPQEIKKIMF